MKIWGGIPSPEGMEVKVLPPWIRDITKRLEDCGAVEKKLNHILLNEYTHGRGIDVCGVSLIKFLDFNFVVRPIWMDHYMNLPWQF